MNCVFDIGYIASVFDVYRGNEIYKIDGVKIADTDFCIKDVTLNSFCENHYDYFKKAKKNYEKDEYLSVLSFNRVACYTCFWNSKFDYYILKFKSLGYFKATLNQKNMNIERSKRVSLNDYIILGLPKSKIKLDDYDDFVMAHLVYEFTCDGVSVVTAKLPSVRAIADGLDVNVSYSNGKFYASSVSRNLKGNRITYISKLNIFGRAVYDYDGADVCNLKVMEDNSRGLSVSDTPCIDVGRHTDIDSNFLNLLGYTTLHTEAKFSENLILPSYCKHFILQDKMGSTDIIKVRRIVFNPKLQSIDIGSFSKGFTNLSNIVIPKTFSVDKAVRLVGDLLMLGDGAACVFGGSASITGGIVSQNSDRYAVFKELLDRGVIKYY